VSPPELRLTYPPLPTALPDAPESTATPFHHGARCCLQEQQRVNIVMEDASRDIASRNRVLEEICNLHALTHPHAFLACSRYLTSLHRPIFPHQQTSQSSCPMRQYHGLSSRTCERDTPGSNARGDAGERLRCRHLVYLNRVVDNGP